MLSEDQSDMLAELLNIAFGRAAAPLARLMGRFVVLSPPNVTFVRSHDAQCWLGTRLGEGSLVHVVQQSFHPRLRGEAVLVMRADGGSHAWGLFADPDDEPDDSEERDAALEVANLLVGACIGRLADLLSTAVRYTPPHLALFRQPLAELPVRSEDDRDLLVVHTRFTVEETAFESCLFLVLSPDVMGWLRETLDDMLDSYLDDEVGAEASVAR